jgi:hypothetical protein
MVGYPFEEFQRDFAELKHIQKREHVGKGGKEFFVPIEDDTFEAFAFRLIGHFSERNKKGVAAKKVSLFSKCYFHLAGKLPEYWRANFAEKEEGNYFVPERLLRSVHYHFSKRKLMTEEDSVKAIIKLAETKFKDYK